MYKSYSMELAGRTLTVDIGRVCAQANGAALIKYGETTVLSTVVASDKPRDGVDFFPLSVEFEEKMYAVGKIPGGFNKREGKASENAILTSRVIDRPMRPLFPKDYRNDVTLNNMVMSVFVTVCAKPITLLKNPYLILGLVFIIGHCLGLVITSAAGLAMLLIVTVYPLIIRVGCSSLSAAAVVASVLCVGYAPASGVAVMAAELVHLDPVEYLVSYQLVMAAPVVLVMAITHVIVQRYFDKKDGVHGYVADFAELEAKRKELEKTPLIYACMPVLPLVLLLIFNKMVYKTITMNVATAMFLSWFVCFLVDLLVRREAKKSFDLSFSMFKGMGSILTSTVGLIFVAAFFAKGLQQTGLITYLIDVAKNCGLGVTGTGVVLSAIIGVVTVLTGSGVAAFTSLAHVIPDVAQHLNSNGIAIMLMMHTASEMLRALSPVAGVIIIVAGFAKVSPFAIIKRTAIPCVVGYITMLIIVSAIF